MGWQHQDHPQPVGNGESQEPWRQDLYFERCSLGPSGEVEAFLQNPRSGSNSSPSVSSHGVMCYPAWAVLGAAGSPPEEVIGLDL